MRRSAPGRPILQQNLERCGVRNAVVSQADPAVLADRLGPRFDGVLVDTPCSGEGMFRKEPAALEQWSPAAVAMCARRQRNILRSAARLVRPGGRLLYSTCTFAPEENERTVGAFLLEQPDFELVETGETGFGRPAFSAEAVAAFSLPGEDAALPGSPMNAAGGSCPRTEEKGTFWRCFGKKENRRRGGASGGKIRYYLFRSTKIIRGVFF